MSCFAYPQLCLVTDLTMFDPVRIVSCALEAGITMLQIRAPHLSSSQFYTWAAALRPLCQDYHVPCLINDHVDVGLKLHADGYQLGRRSLSPVLVRSMVGESALLGASVHSLEEARRSCQESAIDFLLAGTIFPSTSHPGERTAGVALLQELKRAYPQLPLLAIGGITAANAEQVMCAGADGIAVISAVWRAPDIRQAVRDLRYALGLDRER